MLPLHVKCSASLNPLNNNEGLSNGNFYLVEFAMAVFLSLWHMKYLVHVGLPLLPGDSGEQQAGNQKVGAAESSEDVAFKCLHV